MADIGFVWDEFFWTTRVSAPGASEPVRLVYAPEGRGEEPLSDEETATVSTAVDSLPTLWQGLRAPLLAYYLDLHADPDGFDPDDLPAVDSADDVLAMLDLHAISVHQVSRNGHPYVGLEFDCPWDDEHGVGVLMNGPRTVRIGGADTAYLLWIAEEDSKQETRSASPST